MLTVAEKNMAAPSVLAEIRKILLAYVKTQISSEQALDQISMVLSNWEVSNERV